MVVLIIIIILSIIISVYLHNSANRKEAQFNNRPSTIIFPSKDLFINQKYAIINILAFAQGTNSVSAYSDEVNEIINQWISKLGLSKSEMEKSVRHSMSLPPERSLQIIVDSLVEIKDKNFIHSVYQDVKRIAHISGNQDSINFTNELFNDILSQKKM